MKQQNKHTVFFDSSFDNNEQLPRQFTVSFRELDNTNIPQVQVFVAGNQQAGDIIDDNAYENDGYRYHDVFHYTFATLLGWSPCTRAMLRLKRKSNLQIDKIEDGARAAITEEAISLMIFNEAKRKNFFKTAKTRVGKHTLKTIKAMTEPFEVSIRTMEEWEEAILKAYEMFRLLLQHKGGEIYFNMLQRSVTYRPLPPQEKFA
ncbi:hypothetical protein [Olivibacter oleidegradans]|uniref:MazG C-terminal domain-containing protein n=1 Tax=Olivibacter oleidegradans TaxID=760123 RepID=A0ABV6HNK8_9SPHI